MRSITKGISLFKLLVTNVLNCFSEKASSCPLKVKTIVFVFTFKGQLDAFSEKQFKTFVTNNLKNELPFVIDLTKIDFLDSSGLGALVQTAKECKKSKLGFSVVGNSRVAQTIKLVRLGDFLNLKSSLEDALSYLKN